jgi:hypothetical protein
MRVESGSAAVFLGSGILEGCVEYCTRLDV